MFKVFNLAYNSNVLGHSKLCHSVHDMGMFIPYILLRILFDAVILYTYSRNFCITWVQLPHTFENLAEICSAFYVFIVDGPAREVRSIRGRSLWKKKLSESEWDRMTPLQSVEWLDSSFLLPRPQPWWTPCSESLQIRRPQWNICGSQRLCPTFLHPCNDGKVVNLSLILNRERVKMLVGDKLLWILRKDGGFSVKSLHPRLDGTINRTVPYLVPLQGLYFSHRKQLGESYNFG